MLLSFVIASRNDDYMGNSNWRLQTTINMLAHTFLALQSREKLEVVIVDWGSPRPLHGSLNLTGEARSITRFIQVPVETCERMKGESSFPHALALNVGLRRARGDFLAISGSDTFLTPEPARRLLALLEGREGLATPVSRTLMILPRRHVPREIASGEPSPEGLLKFISTYGDSLPFDPITPIFLTVAGALLLHREILLQCRGLNEELIHWGHSDSDLVSRVRLHYPATDLGREKGLFVFHLQHSQASGHRRPFSPRKENEMPFGPLAANGPDWGLGRERFQEHPPVEPLDVSRRGPAREILPLRRPRWRHLRNILRLSLRASPREGISALILLAKVSVRNRAVRWVLSRARIPGIFKSTPIYQRRIKGPWEGKG